MKSTFYNRIISAQLGLLLLLCLAGCQQRTAGKLSGQWIGRPDTAAARAVREAEKYGDQVEAATEQDTPVEKAADQQPSSTTEQPTDWENYEVTVSLEFQNSEEIKMSLGNGEQPLQGTWKIVATSPAGCTIEVQTKSEDSDGAESSIVRRRFDLLLDEREGVCVGFQLTESGADPRLGSLYFQRPAS